MKEFWKEEGWIGVDSISQGVVFNDAQGHATVIAYTPSSSWLEIDGFVAKDHAHAKWIIDAILDEEGK